MLKARPFARARRWFAVKTAPEIDEHLEFTRVGAGQPRARSRRLPSRRRKLNFVSSGGSITGEQPERFEARLGRERADVDLC